MDIGNVTPIGRTPQVPPPRGDKGHKKALGSTAEKVVNIAQFRPAMPSYQGRISSDAKREAKKASSLISRLRPALAKLKAKGSFHGEKISPISTRAARGQKKGLAMTSNKVVGIAANMRPPISSYQKRVASQGKKVAQKAGKIISRLRPTLAQLKTIGPS